MRPATLDRRFLAALLLPAWLMAAAPAEAPADDPANDPRVRAVAEQLLCYCGCNTQSVAACACGVARKERAAIQGQLDSGSSADDIVAEWVEARGTGILIEPPREGFNLLGWFLPSILLLAAAGILGFRIRHWAGHQRLETPGPAAPAADPHYLEKLQRDLDAMDR
jgi:cytochrome c-type biogenesis protein CcmH